MLQRARERSAKASRLRSLVIRASYGEARRSAVGAKAARYVAPSDVSRAIQFVRADIRALPFVDRTFGMVLAPYGMLQSLLTDADLALTLASTARVLRPGGLFGIDLVPDVPRWAEYRNRVQLRGRAGHGAHLTLVESVRHMRRRRLTIFEQRYLERRNGRTREHRFELTFRTVSVPEMARRLAHAGFRVEAVLGDYRNQPWDERADVWIILATKCRS